MADKQLDIFGTPHPRKRQGALKAPWQPSLIPDELEAAANADEMRAALERFQAACDETFDATEDQS